MLVCLVRVVVLVCLVLVLVLWCCAWCLVCVVLCVVFCAVSCVVHGAGVDMSTFMILDGGEEISRVYPFLKCLCWSPHALLCAMLNASDCEISLLMRLL